MDERDEWLTRLRRMRLAWPVRCARTFTPDEMAKLAEGLWPTSLEDRWVVWLNQGQLRAWRGATGECIYEAELSVDIEGAGHCRILRVCDDPEMYTRSPADAGELDRFDGVLAQLLGRRREAAA